MYQITFNTLIKQLADSNSKLIQNLWCDTIGKLFFTSWVDNVAMTAIGPVLPGLHGNQLLGNQSIFDFENGLLALPPSPLTSPHLSEGAALCERLIENSRRLLE